MPAAPGLAIDYQLRDYDSSEYTPAGFLLNREQGRLRGLGVEFAQTAPGGRWSLRASQEQGRLSYDGFSQMGIPIFTSTQLRARSLALRWSAPRDLALGRVSIGTGAEVARQRIDRAIQPGPLSQALTEILDVSWVRGVARAGVPVHSAWSLQFEAMLAWPFSQRIEVDSFGTYDTFRLKPRSRISGRIGAGVAWQPSTVLRAGLWATREEWRFGHSASRPVRRGGEIVGSAEYPGSRQKLDGVMLRLETWY